MLLQGGEGGKLDFKIEEVAYKFFRRKKNGFMEAIGYRIHDKSDLSNCKLK